MIVLALDENLDPTLVSDLLKEAGFKVVGEPSAPYAVFDQSLDGLLQRTSEAGAAPITSDTATPTKAGHDPDRRSDPWPARGAPVSMRLAKTSRWRLPCRPSFTLLTTIAPSGPRLADSCARVAMRSRPMNLQNSC